MKLETISVMIDYQQKKFHVHSFNTFDSVYKRDKNYYPQTTLEECKYKVEVNTSKDI